MNMIAALLLLAPLTAITKDDLRKLAAARCSDDAILMLMRARGPVEPLGVDDLIELRNAGLSPRVLRALAVYSPLAPPPPLAVYAPPPPPCPPPLFECRPRYRPVIHSHRPVRACPRGR